MLLKGGFGQARRLCCLFAPAACYVSFSRLGRVALSPTELPPKGPPPKEKAICQAEVLGRAAVKPLHVRTNMAETFNFWIRRKNFALNSMTPHSHRFWLCESIRSWNANLKTLPMTYVGRRSRLYPITGQKMMKQGPAGSKRLARRPFGGHPRTFQGQDVCFLVFANLFDPCPVRRRGLKDPTLATLLSDIYISFNI